MRCVNCNSPRTIRFIDGFGEPRVFCKTCQESMLIENVILAQKNVWEFSQPNKMKVPKRWENERDREVGSFASRG